MEPAADDGAPISRRERKKLRTRDALEAAALRLFAEKGYVETTIEEIAEAADVAVRTFFRYFQSKQHVLFGDVAHDVTARLRITLAAQPAGADLIDSIGTAMASLEFGDDDRRQILDRMRLVERMPALSGAYHMLFQDLHNAIVDFTAARAGVAPKDLYPQLLGGAATASIKASLTAFESHPDGPALGEILAGAYASLTEGLRT